MPPLATLEARKWLEIKIAAPGAGTPRAAERLLRSERRRFYWRFGADGIPR